MPGNAHQQIAAWAAGHAADRLFGGAEVAAAFGMTAPNAQSVLAGAVAAGLVRRWWRNAYSLPAAGPFTRGEDRPAKDKIVAFVAADGGAAFWEIRDGIPLDGGVLAAHLTGLVRGGRLIRLPQPGMRGGFYVLPGQEPGEVLAPPPGPGSAQMAGVAEDAQVGAPGGGDAV